MNFVNALVLLSLLLVGPAAIAQVPPQQSSPSVQALTQDWQAQATSTAHVASGIQALINELQVAQARIRDLEIENQKLKATQKPADLDKPKK